MQALIHALLRSRTHPLAWGVLVTVAACAGSTGPSPTGLAFMTQPSSAIAGAPIAVSVAIQDEAGHTQSGATNAVTIAIGANAGPGTLLGTTTVNAMNGVATFSGLAIDKAGTGYTLVASSNSLTSASSSSFDVVPGPVASVWVNPGAAILTFPIGSNTIQLQATALDSYDNVVPTTITWTSSDPNAATVDPTGRVVGNSVVGNWGLATIHASANGKVGTSAIAVSCVPPRCSRPFSVSFTQEPTSTRAGSTISPPVQVSLMSTGGSWSGGSVNLYLFLGYNPGNSTLTGNSDAFVSGFVTTTWSSLSVDRPAVGGYTLVAIVRDPSTGRAWGVSSAAFNVTP